MQKIKYLIISLSFVCFFTCLQTEIQANMYDTIEVYPTISSQAKPPNTGSSNQVCVNMIEHGKLVENKTNKCSLLTTPNEYSFIAYDSNYLVIPPSAKPIFDKLFSEIQALVENNAHNVIQIFHFGDSHIQADFFSNRIRENADKYFAFSENCFRNFVFPYNIAKTNSLTNYRTTYGGVWNNQKSTLLKDSSDLGMVGMRLETFDSSAWIKICRLHQNDQKLKLASCKVYHNFGSGIPIPTLENAKSVSYPDLGYTEFVINGMQDSFCFRFEREIQDTEYLYIHGFEFTPFSPLCCINNFGVNGASLSSMHRCNLLWSQLNISTPNLIILSFGTNDIYKKFDKEKFINEYSVLLDSIEANSPYSAIILTTPADFMRSQKYDVQELKEVSSCIKELAHKHHCAYWDLYEIGGGYNSIQKWYNAGLANKDKVHFLKSGYQVQADLFFDAFYQAYSQYINNHSTKR